MVVKEVRLYRDEDGRRIETWSDGLSESCEYVVVFESLAMLNTAFGPVISLTDEHISLPTATSLVQAFEQHDQAIIDHNKEIQKKLQEPKLVVAKENDALIR